MIDLTAKQEQELHKRLQKIIVKLMHLYYVTAKSKLGINKDFADKEHMCFVGYIAAFCDCFAQQYGARVSCGEFACSLYTEVRKELYNDKTAIVNPIENIEEFMLVDEFREGFVAGLNDVTEYFRKLEIEAKRRPMGLPTYFILALKNL